MKEKFRQPQTAIRWLFAGFTLLCLMAAVVSAALYHESAPDILRASAASARSLVRLSRVILTAATAALAERF